MRWVVPTAVGIVVLLVVHLRVALDVADRRIGVQMDTTASPIEVLAVTPGEPADAAGVVPGDRLLAVDGQPLREAADYDRIARGFDRGREVEIEVRRDERRLELRVVPGTSFEAWEFGLNALACLLYLALGLLASGQRADDLRSALLAAFCLAVAAELALPYEILSAASGAGLAATVAFLLLTGLQFGLDLHLATVLPTTPRWLPGRAWVVHTYYAVGLGVGGFAAATTLGVAMGIPASAPLDALANELMFTWLLPVWSIVVASIIGRRAVAHPDPRGRMQAGLVLLGVLPWVAVVLVETVRTALDESFAGFSPVVWNFSLLAYPVAVFVAIFLYRLFDLELVVRKSLLYGALTTLLVLGFYGLVGGIGALFARDFGSEGVPLWVLSTAGLSMGLLFNPLRTRLQRLIDRRLFPERLALRSRLVALAADLPAQGKLPRMGEHLARELSRIFASEPVTVWIAAPPQGQLVQLASTQRGEVDLEQTALIGGDDPAVQLVRRAGRPLPASALVAASAAIGQRLAGARAELVVPLLAQERIVGLIAFGAKRDDQRWVAEELELLTLVGHHAATVFENARLFDSATFEGLTGLLRREALLEILDREWSRSQRYDRPLAIALADLDRFKEVNDRFGHLAGDLVLQRVAAELRAQLRETDFIGRFGGEEFLIVLPETTLEGARQFAEKVRQRVEQLEVPNEAGKPLRVTVSIGVAARPTGERDDGRGRARTLIATADEALYAAKNNGRNRVEAAVES